MYTPNEHLRSISSYDFDMQETPPCEICNEPIEYHQSLSGNSSCVACTTSVSSTYGTHEEICGECQTTVGVIDGRCRECEMDFLKQSVTCDEWAVAKYGYDWYCQCYRCATAFKEAYGSDEDDEEED